VNIATLYHYFPTKKSIYDEVVSGAVKDTISKLLKASSGSDAPELRLRRFISMLTRIYFGSNLDARIIDREQLEGGGLHPARDAQRTFHSDVQNLVAEIFDHSLLDEEVDRETRFLIGMIYGAVKLRATHEIVCGKTLYAEKSLADQLFDHYLDIVHVKKRARLRKE
jgi:AcrR family transcriptional regulator